jgi:hypothetical protein
MREGFARAELRLQSPVQNAPMLLRIGFCLGRLRPVMPRARPEANCVFGIFIGDG